MTREMTPEEQRTWAELADRERAESPDGMTGADRLARRDGVIRKLVNEAADQARRLKEMECEDNHDRDRRPALRPSIQGWRGADPVALMIPSQVDRDAGLRAAYLCATGFGCDSIAFSVDTWSATTMTNPLTKKRWGPREMQDLADNHDGVAKGWISDGLSTFVVNRAGDLASVMQRYTLKGRDNPLLGRWVWSVTWGERYSDDALEPGAPDKIDGLVPEALISYMNLPTLQQDITAHTGLSGADFGLDAVETQAHTDCAVVKTMRLAGFDGAVILMSDDPKRTAIIDRSLGHLQVRMEDL